mgnify:CR=1 FL=1|jgi:hypothetical protein|nr:MAG TPA: hypothetical protein [Caudoviricetes sp.]
MRKLTETEKELVKKLRAIWNDKEFVIGVLSYLKDDEERAEVAEFIDSNDDVTSESVTLLALDISQKRDNVIVDAFFSDLEKIAKEL